MASGLKKKQSLYFPETMLAQMAAEAHRLDRSLSWIVQKAWKASRKEIMHLPPAEGIAPENAETDGTK